ncbi:hypothetical protein COMNV_01476 [Commensalibacter sp. Nvir]|uniref:Hint domain-containing protein n=1 Tax=Commensalibacter sp. Nvir TaxID=3069817 RepID=UPI002D611482|nr:hypothetical protein COMNV_01476 [Commensalibacter sp. Nvir]
MVSQLTGSQIDYGISVSGGSLEIDSFMNSATSNWTLTVSEQGSATITGNTSQSGSAITINEIDINSSGNNTFTNLITSTLYLEAKNSGTTTLVSGTYTTITVDGGELDVTGNVTVNSLNYSLGFLEVNSGGNLTYTGTNMQIPTSDSTNQCFTLNGGTFTLTPSSTGSVEMTGSLLVTSEGGTLTLNNTDLTIDNSLALTNGNLTISGTGKVTINDLVASTGKETITLTNGVNLDIANIDPQHLTSSPIFQLQQGSVLTFDQSFTGGKGFNVDFESKGGCAILRFGKKVTASTFNADEFDIEGFDKQDKLDFQGIDFTKCTDFSATYSGGKLTITYKDSDNNLQTIVFNSFDKQDSPFTDDTQLIVKSDDNGGTMILGCFLPGSQILTALGYRAVEDLKVGDAIHTFANGSSTLEPIEWIGKTRCHVRPNLPADFAGVPVRVMKDAIAPNVPFEDLTLTSEHCLCLDNQFIPVRMLVNGASIVYDHSLTSYDYYHIETKTHTIISANGLLTETYLDTGNRKVFKESSGAQLPDIYPVKTWDDAAAPLTTQPEIVEPIFNALKQRAHQLGFESHYVAPLLVEDPDLRVITDKGVTLFPSTIAGNTYTFTLPSNVGHIRIQSRSSRPCDTIGPFFDDRRSLGVLIGSITVTKNGQSHAIRHHLEEPALLGWHGIENDTCRWTDGNATLSLQGVTSGHEGSLSVEVLSKGPYLLTNSERLQKTS